MPANDLVKTLAGVATLAIGLTLSGAALSESLTLSDGTFSALDADGDGRVSPEEFSYFSGYAFGDMDADKNGLLGPDEVSPHLDAEAFKLLDKDGNGAVSPQEFSQQMSADFKSADRDGDGFLN